MVQTTFIGLKVCLSFGQFGTATTAATEDQSFWTMVSLPKNCGKTGKQNSKAPQKLKKDKQTTKKPISQPSLTYQATNRNSAET